jgi:L-2-hydroxyglutarate oxidase LhgO
MEKVDITIVGAGIVGLAIASEVAKKDKITLIIEKESAFGQHTSSRNSEVLHAGIYYPKDSLKTKTCIEGNRLVYKICQENNIPYRRLGKLIVISEEDEIPILHDLFERGKNNAVEGLELLSSKQVRQIEPNIKCKEAIYSPNTGIVDTHKLMEYFLEVAKDKSADIVYNSEVKEIEKLDTGYYKVGIFDENTKEMIYLQTEILINAAGLYADSISQMVGIRDKDYELKYCKGQYFRLKPAFNNCVSHLIYPLPDSKGVSSGVHLTLDLTGSVRVGPDAEYIEKKIDYAVDLSKVNQFYKEAVKFLSINIDPEDLSPDTAGIRAKLQGKGEDFRDFIIKEEKSKGFPGFINLIGIDSPGLTASPAIAKLVREMISYS